MRLVLHVITHFLWGLEICRLIKDILMHQSIPAVPIPPPGNLMAHVVSPGGGAFGIRNFIAAPGAVH